MKGGWWQVSGVFTLQKVGGGKLQVAGNCGQWWGGSFTLQEAGGGHCERGWLEVVCGSHCKWAVAVHVARGGWWTLRAGGSSKLWVVGIASGQWVVCSSHCERWVVVIASRWWWEVVGDGHAREVVIVSGECSRQPRHSWVDVPGVAGLKVAGGGPWMCEQWVARVGRHYGGGWWMLQWVVDGEHCRW